MLGSWVPHQREACQRMHMSVSRSVCLPTMRVFSRRLLSSATSHTQKVASWINTVQTNASWSTNHYWVDHSPSIARWFFLLCITPTSTQPQQTHLIHLPKVGMMTELGWNCTETYGYISWKKKQKQVLYIIVDFLCGQHLPLFFSALVQEQVGSISWKRTNIRRNFNCKPISYSSFTTRTWFCWSDSDVPFFDPSSEKMQMWIVLYIYDGYARSWFVLGILTK